MCPLYVPIELQTLDVVAYICNPSALKSEAGGLQVPGQPGLPGETLSQNNNNNKKTKQNSHVDFIHSTFQPWPRS
jgi:hypothetical protein